MCKTYECPYYHEDLPDERRDMHNLTNNPSSKVRTKKGKKAPKPKKAQVEPLLESSDSASITMEFDTPRSGASGSQPGKNNKKTAAVNYATDNSQTDTVSS